MPQGEASPIAHRHSMAHATHGLSMPSDWETMSSAVAHAARRMAGPSVVHNTAGISLCAGLHIAPSATRLRTGGPPAAV